uniref:hypothetical protein n=1 Tax=Oceanispirochaeta sp. TaxID=2035350 RepID=UPI002639D232
EYNCSLKVHSRHHLELKSVYPLLDESGLTRYDMSFYFFFPNQLNVTEKRIGVERFINTIKIYTRYSTPGLSLTSLIDRNCDLSPLVRIRQYLEMTEIEQSHKKDILLYELQVLTNIYRAELEKTIELLGIEIQKQNRDNMCSRKIKQFLDEVQSFLKDFRKLHALFINPRIGEVQRKALAWADEAISIATERSLNSLFSHTQVMESSEHLLKAYEKITMSETEYRTRMDYQYLNNKEDTHSGERLAYRESFLKKWSQSAMYMTNEDSRAPLRVGHILAGIAAGVAMIFAVLITILAGKIFIPNSTPWILIIVLAYIFKDRIKEMLREVFKKLLPQLTSDQRSILFDQSLEKRVGVSRGIARFEKASTIPDNIFSSRYIRQNPFRSILPEEDVIFYKRTIRLNARKLMKNHSRLNSVTEIIRLNIDDWLKEMDDPKDIFYHLENMKKIKIKGNRVYKIHLVMSLKNNVNQELEELNHYCVILNKVGILRIEAMDE